MKLQEIVSRLRRFFQILPSDIPPGSRRLNQVILTTSDRQVLLREYEDFRMKREADKILLRKEYELRRNIDKQKRKDLYDVLCRISHVLHIEPNMIFILKR